jgi:hypothetical protein
MEASATLNRRQRRWALNMPRKHNNRKSNDARRVQLIYDEPVKIFVERYITDHMLEKAIRLGLSKKAALAKYGKNRYRVNPEAKVSKIIIHKY